MFDSGRLRWVQPNEIRVRHQNRSVLTLGRTSQQKFETVGCISFAVERDPRELMRLRGLVEAHYPPTDASCTDCTVHLTLALIDRYIIELIQKYTFVESLASA